MSAKMEYKGKDVAEAIHLACAKLKLPREKLDIEILATGSAGIFGLCRKKAKILVTVKGQAGGQEKPGTPKVFGKKARGKGNGGNSKYNGSRGRVTAPADAVPLSQETISSVQEDLDKILELMGFSVETSLSAEGNKIKAHILGDNLEDVVGSEGQTLDGMQYLLRKIITRKFPEKVKFALDAGNFRENRAKDLEQMSLKLAVEVKETGKTRTIPALNPAERRIVHMVLQNDNTIRSRSVGEGLFKKILIYLPGKGRGRSPRKNKSTFAKAQR